MVESTMSVRLVDRGWDKEFDSALHVNSSSLRIICPFIKLGALQNLLDKNPRSIQVITRFNLADFAAGVSDVASLQALLNADARVRGMRNLHAKMYLFGDRRAIITSCNLTTAALTRNYELGLIAENKALIVKCQEYFDELWNGAGEDLTQAQVDDWDKVIARHYLRGGRPAGANSLRDFGANTGLPIAPSPLIPPTALDSSAFLKFLGTADNRAEPDVSIIEEIDRAECHWAVCYPANRRPRSIENGDVVFMGRLMREPNDIRVFGRAIAMAHVPRRDEATPADIARRSWKEHWPRYVRVHDAEFVNGVMANGVSLNELMHALRARSFASTQRNLEAGTGNIDPRRAYRQQAHVELSGQGQRWLSEQLERAFAAHGKVSPEALASLDWPSF